MKQALLIRTDLKMSPGKIAAQAAHASVEAVLCSPKKKLDAWKLEGMKKIVLQVSNEQELKAHYQRARTNKLTVALITDKGLTEIPPNSTTAVGIGPDTDDAIDAITKTLKTL